MTEAEEALVDVVNCLIGTLRDEVRLSRAYGTYGAWALLKAAAVVDGPVIVAPKPTE